METPKYHRFLPFFKLAAYFPDWFKCEKNIYWLSSLIIVIKSIYNRLEKNELWTNSYMPFLLLFSTPDHISGCYTNFISFSAKNIFSFKITSGNVNEIANSIRHFAAECDPINFITPESWINQFGESTKKPKKPIHCMITAFLNGNLMTFYSYKQARAWEFRLSHLCTRNKKAPQMAHGNTRENTNELELKRCWKMIKMTSEMG